MSRLQGVASEAVQEPDTGAAVADSVGRSLGQIGEGVTATGRLILAGEWEVVVARAMEAGTELFAAFVPNLLSALFVGLIFFGLYRIVAGVTEGALRRSARVGVGLRKMAMKSLRVAGWGFIALLVLSQLGVDLSALIAGLGIAGLAVGFAAKDSLENFISGLTILLDRPFRVGDWITVGDHYGRIADLSLRSTRLKTLNGETVVFPNVEMVTRAVVNHTMGGTLRVDVPFGIAYKEDVNEAREVVMGLVDDDDERLAPEGDHRVVTTELGDSSVAMELHLFVGDAGDAVPLRFEFTEKIRTALGAAEIEIPFPHLQLFIDGAKALEDTPIRLAGDD